MRWVFEHQASLAPHLACSRRGPARSDLRATVSWQSHMAAAQKTWYQNGTLANGAKHQNLRFALVLSIPTSGCLAGVACFLFIFFFGGPKAGTCGQSSKPSRSPEAVFAVFVFVGGDPKCRHKLPLHLFDPGQDEPRIRPPTCLFCPAHMGHFSILST